MTSWTKEPTETGYYWSKVVENKDHRPSIVWIANSMVHPIGDEKVSVVYLAKIGYCFYGPLPQPPEP